MNRVKKKIVAVGIVVLSSVSMLLGFNQVGNAEEQPFTVEAKSAIAVDADSGKIFYEQDSKTPHYIASTTKLISMYLVYDQIKQGKLQWMDKVKISSHIAKISQNKLLSNVPLYENSEYTVNDLVHAGLLESANAAVMALAENISGTEPKFVDHMKAKLKEWGIKDAQLYNSTGLNNSFLDKKDRYPNSEEDAENKMSARDMAIVARHLVNDFPEVLKVTSTSNADFNEPNGWNQPIRSTNYMLPGMPLFMEGVDGLKTGTTDLAGANFVSTIKKNNIRLITVMFDVTNGVNYKPARFLQTQKLINYIYDNWHIQTVISANTPVVKPKTIPVDKGKQESVGLLYKDPIQLWVQKDMDPTKLNIHSTVSNKQSIEAPVLNNEKIGTATVELSQDQLGYLDSNNNHQTIIVTDKEIEKANIFVQIWRSVKKIFS